MTDKIAKPWEPWKYGKHDSWARLGSYGKVVAHVYLDYREVAICEGDGFKHEKAPSIEAAKVHADSLLREKGYHLRNFMYEFPRRATAVDAVVFGAEGRSLKILLIQRSDKPYKGMWALPGGFLDEDLQETADQAVKRELEEETGLKGIYLEQLYTFTDPKRDPREPINSLSYVALVRPENLEVQAGSDASDARWFDVTDLPKLAFDHAKIIKTGLERIAGKVRYQPIGFELLPKEFTLTQLQELYEAILQRTLDKRNFRRKILAMGILKEVEGWQMPTRGKLSALYSFDRKEYDRLVKEGFNFEV